MIYRIPIHFDCIKIGESELERRGLFWKISMTYKLPDNQKYICKLNTGELCIDLGLLPYDGKLNLVKSIPNMRDLHSCTMNVEMHTANEDYLLIDTSMPFAHINVLPYARVRQHNGNWYLCVIDQE